MLVYDNDKVMYDLYVDWDLYSLYKWIKNVYCVNVDYFLDIY